MSSRKRYTDAEVHAIFERAAVRQEEAERAEDASRAGLSLTELQQIGKEAGIDPAHVALAASELSVMGTTAGSQVSEDFLGIPTRISRTRRLRRHIGDEEWEQIVHEMRGIFGRDGIAGELGKVREWTVTSSVGKFDRPVKVTLKPDGDDLLVIINQEMKGQAMGFSIATGIYLLMGLVMTTLHLFEADVPIAVGLMFFGMAALFFGGTQIGTRIHASRQRTRFERALDRIELIAGHSSVGSEPIHTSDIAPEIDLDALPDAPATVSEQQSLQNRDRE